MLDNQIYTDSETGLNAFYAKVYAFVGMGVGLSALVSGLLLTVFPMAMIEVLHYRPWLYFGAVILELVLVMFASRTAHSNSPMALPLYIAYSALNGYTLTFIILRYTQETVLAAFVSSALLFFVMALIGRFIPKDLSGLRKALMAGLIGLILAGFVNMFLGSSTMSLWLSFASVVIFSGLIAYENQLIKRVYYGCGGQVTTGWAISMALALYLDFVNLFISLLRIFARRR